MTAAALLQLKPVMLVLFGWLMGILVERNDPNYARCPCCGRRH